MKPRGLWAAAGALAASRCVGEQVGPFLDYLSADPSWAAQEQAPPAETPRQRGAWPRPEPAVWLPERPARGAAGCARPCAEAEGELCWDGTCVYRPWALHSEPRLGCSVVPDDEWSEGRLAPSQRDRCHSAAAVASEFNCQAAARWCRWYTDAPEWYARLRGAPEGPVHGPRAPGALERGGAAAVAAARAVAVAAATLPASPTLSYVLGAGGLPDQPAAPT
ncbi:unnamed protein product [Prorocentrum cordatum]|uniref:Uncharacterized protein n=1 Tax=Prorocentrum cordatum TaxID=2364126 RepID=A0ABN9T7S4_9DINO|nr:unnamed protein product [Polarella glacialis]